MRKISTKAAADAALRELPSVLGVSVKEDVFGHPREVHLLVGPGPDPRLLAREVRALLEARLGVPVDQRVISIAQLGRPLPPGLLATEDGVEAAGNEAGQAGLEIEGQPPRGARLIFGGLESAVREGRVTVRVRLGWGGEGYEAEATDVDTGPGRVRAGAAATLRAAALACEGELRLELEAASLVRALDRDYALVSVIAVAPSLGRRPLPLSGVHPQEEGPELAGALAALKATNRVLGLRLRSDGEGRRPPPSSGP
jgi:hypothetical protein